VSHVVLRRPEACSPAVSNPAQVVAGRPRDGVRRDLRLSIGDGAGYGVMAGVAEVYLPAFGLALGMAPAAAGLLATMPLLAGGLLQLLAPHAIARAKSLRGWTVGCIVVQALSFVPLIAIALGGTVSQPLVFGAAAVFWAAGMAASAAWNPWMARVVPVRLRGRFFGQRQRIVQVTMLLGLVGAGVALHACAGTPHVLDAYAAMFALAMIARLASAWMLSRQGRGVEASPQRRMRLRSIAPRLRGTPRASLLGYLVAAFAAASIAGPFLTPYVLDHHGFGYAEYSVFTATIVVAKIVALPALGRLIQRVGVRRVLTTCALAIAPLPVLWALSGSFTWLLAVQIYGGIAWAGFELGMLMALFDGNDDAERITLQVAFSALQSIGTAGASIVGGVMLASLGADHAAYLWVFAVSAVARLAAVVLLVRELPRVLARLPVTFVARAWTLAIRPWGGTIVRPIVDRLGRRGDRS
jgi:hypothetical protein